MTRLWRSQAEAERFVPSVEQPAAQEPLQSPWQLQEHQAYGNSHQYHAGMHPNLSSTSKSVNFLLLIKAPMDAQTQFTKTITLC